jgi:hypothetical protein
VEEFSISGVGTFCLNCKRVSKLATERDYENGNCMEPAHNRVQWRNFAVVVLNLWVLLPDSQLVGYVG